MVKLNFEKIKIDEIFFEVTNTNTKLFSREVHLNITQIEFPGRDPAQKPVKI